MKRELAVLLKRNKIQLIIAVVCIVITIKQMNAPLVVPYNAVTAFLFEKAPEGSVYEEGLSLINDLGFAYYSSLVFYFVVDYFPQRKKEKTAFLHVRDHVSDLASYIHRLIVDLLFFANIDGSYTSFRKVVSSLPELAKLELTNKKVICNWEFFDERTGETDIGSYCDTTDSFTKIHMDCDSIKNCVEIIREHIGADGIEEELAILLTRLYENTYVKHMIRLNSSYLESGGAKIICACSDYDLLELLLIEMRLKKYPIKRLRYKIEECDPTEYEELQLKFEEFKKQHAESYRIIENMMNSK